VYLGVAAGVGTTYAMLDEAIRRRQRGTVVMVGCVITHDRPHTVDRLEQLTGQSPSPVELDVQAVIAEHPDVVIVDELAHRNPSTAPRPHRWQDVDVLLAAGIDVITTLTVQHIDSLSDPVREIVGSTPDATVPDEFLGRADQIEIVDISPEAIRRRIAHGNVFVADELRPTDADLFNSESFAELRALMMFWMADRLAAGPDDPPGAREKVVVAIADNAATSVVLRRAARLAQRSRTTMVGVHVKRGKAQDVVRRAARREAVERLGGSYYEVAGEDIARALVDFTDSQHATQLVLGTSQSRRWKRWLRRTVVDEVVRRSPTVDVHVVSVDEQHDQPARRPPRGPLSAPRQLTAAVAGAGLLAAMTAVLTANRETISVATSLSLYLLAVVAITAVGGPKPGLVAAVSAPLLANWFLIEPYHTLRISRGENLLELLVFVSVASIVAAFVLTAARRADDAQRARREASTLAMLTSSGNPDLPDVIVGQLRSVFHLTGVAVLSDEGSEPDVVAASGIAPRRRADADIVEPIGAGFVVAATGPALSADDHRIMQAFLGQLSRAFEQQQLRAVAAEADALAKADDLRTAMLRAVSHDLRSPLANIKASVSSLRQPDVEWSAADQSDFLASIEADTDRLTNIVTNLLDLSRLEAGVLHPVVRSVSLEEVVPVAIHGLGPLHRRVAVDLPADLPEVRTDPALLERVLANLVANACHWSPEHALVRVRAHASSGRVQVHVIDHGPGIPAAQRSIVVQPFHRLGDKGTGSGLGLGLAIADRLVAAMSGTMALRDTPGGGLTIVVSLPLSAEEGEQR
jgi:two-component system sensor histidine kinase KdpD